MTVDVNLMATWPVLAPLLAAVLVLLLDAALPHRRTLHLYLTAAGLLAGAAAAAPGLFAAAGDRAGAFCLDTGQCLYAADRLASTLQFCALLGGLVVLVLSWGDWSRASATDRAPVVGALLLGATAGTVAIPAAGDLGTLLVALELATIPTVALVALTDPRWSSSRRADAVDGAVALLTTSLVSFGLLALGAALWVAATGSALLAQPTTEHPGLLLIAAIFVLCGLAFKVSAVPFHAWTPLTYASAPLPITAYLATVSKIAAVGALVVLIRALGTIDDTTLLAVALLAALSMTIGNVVALVQEDSVRLLAWSTVAQAGWVLLPLASLSSRAAHAAASYLIVYVVATLLAFVVVIAFARLTGSTSLESQRGSVRSHPLLALALGLSLLTLAGLPPAVAGLIAKVVALRPVAGDGTWWLAIVAALNVALGIAVYIRWFTRLLRAPMTGEELSALPSPGQGEPRPTSESGEARPASESGEPRPASEPEPRPSTSPALWALVGVLAALLIMGSITPLGVI